MAIIFDAGLLDRRARQALTAFDLCKVVLCAAMAEALPGATVYSSAQAQGVTAPAVFVRFGKMASQAKLDGIERVTLEVQCHYLPATPEDDGENETAMQAMLDALWEIDGGEADLHIRERAAERTEAGAAARGALCADIRRENAAGLAEGIMQTLSLTARAI